MKVMTDYRRIFSSSCFVRMAKISNFKFQISNFKYSYFSFFRLFTICMARVMTVAMVISQKKM